MVFQLISRRYERGSVIFGDDVLAAAILDRMLHPARSAWRPPSKHNEVGYLGRHKGPPAPGGVARRSVRPEVPLTAERLFDAEVAPNGSQEALPMLLPPFLCNGVHVAKSLSRLCPIG